MAHFKRFAAVSGMAAALSMAATPVVAADLPTASPQPSAAALGVFDKDAVNVENHRYYRYRRHNRVDAGDVLAGVLIIGGIAAIASAASKNSRDQRYRDRDYRYRDRDYRSRDYDYRERREDSRYNSGNAGRGIDNAVQMCVSRIERDVRVDTVDGVDRSGEGWRVTGSLYNGERFTCSIDANGRIDDVSYGGFAAAEDNQRSDDRYRAAWADLESGRIAPPEQRSPQQVRSVEGQPAYPGGPLPGEEIDGDLPQDDRYSTANASDFGG